jgi:hypothetical protein
MHICFNISPEILTMPPPVYYIIDEGHAGWNFRRQTPPKSAIFAARISAAN